MHTDLILPRTLPSPVHLLYVDAVAGSDAASGALHSPLKTVHRALDLVAAASIDMTVLLRGGTHYAGSKTLEITPAH